MANTFITPQAIAAAGLGTYQFNAVLPRLVNRVYETDFGGGSGDTITIRKQATLTTHLFDRGDGITKQNITDGSTTFTVGDLWDASAVITQEQWDLELTDFNFQVSEPIGKAMVRRSELVIDGVLDVLTPASSAFTSEDYDNVLNKLTGARALLNAAEVPLDNRICVIGSNVATAFLNLPNVLDNSQSGDSNALRNAQIGRLRGMPIIESVVVDPDKMYVWHRDAVTFASITPSMPRGASEGAVATYDGQAMRVVFGYDQDYKQDTISADAYLQAKVIRPEAITVVTFDAASL